MAGQVRPTRRGRVELVTFPALSLGMSRKETVAAQKATGAHGQFGELARTENSGLDLGARDLPNPEFPTPGPVKLRAGQGVVAEFDAVSTIEAHGDRQRAIFRVGGYPHKRACLAAAAVMAADEVDDPGLSERVGKKVSMLVTSEAGTLTNFEGTVSASDDTFVQIRAKGSRSAGYTLPLARIVAVRDGYCSDELNADFAEIVRQVPATEPVGDLSDLPTSTGNYYLGQAITAAFLLDLPGAGDKKIRGAVFFAADRQIDEAGGQEEINGYLWCPPTTSGSMRLSNDTGFSQHGSFSIDDLKRMGGRITGYRSGSLTFADCLDLPEGRGEVYQRAVT